MKIVALPWGLDEIEVEVVEEYRSGGVERAVVELPAGFIAEEASTVAVPVSTLNLLPAKPMGQWLVNALKADKRGR